MSEETARDHSLERCRDAQRTVATHRGPSLVVRGPAGSGKTWALHARFRALLHAGTAPEAIWVIVPSAARARELRATLELELRVGYEALAVLDPATLAARCLRDAGADCPPPVLGAPDRLALLTEHLDELSLRHHDFGGRPAALLAGFVRRIDRLKAERVSAEAFGEWAAGLDPACDAGAEREREFAALYADHERLLGRAGAWDEGGLLLAALAAGAGAGAGAAPGAARASARPEHVIVDDAHELDLAAATLVLARAPADGTFVAAGDPDAAVSRFRGAGAERLEALEDGLPGCEALALGESRRCPPAVWRAARAALDRAADDRAADDRAADDPSVELWRCTDERAQAQAVALEIERLIGRGGAAPDGIAVIVPRVSHEGQAIAVALQERAIPHRTLAEAAFFQRAEIRDVLAWLRLLADPGDAPAVVRALARPPIELRSVDIARCTQIARRRKLDMVAGLAAALQSPQVPPDARDRIRVFLRLHRASREQIDSSRPDLYVHRLLERLGLRRQQLFAAQADVVERLRALAAFEALAEAHAARAPQATPREFARAVAAVAEVDLGRESEPEIGGELPGVRVLSPRAAGGLEVDHVFVVGLRAGVELGDAPEPIPDALLGEPLPPEDEASRERATRQALYLACSRARRRLVLAYPGCGERGDPSAPAAGLERIRAALGAVYEDRVQELFGPEEALHSTYRLLRDELLQGTLRAAGRLGEMRLDTDLDISHAVVRYLELLKLAALIARGERGETPAPGLADSLRDINARILQAVSADQREIFETSALDEHLLAAERDTRLRAQAIIARDEPSLEAFLPLRGDGVVLSASDIDTYRTCPLKYKFARVFRIPQEPTVHQRFGILVHQVLERYHGEGASASGPAGGLPDLLGLLDAGWRRGGFGDSEQERQLRGKATAALTRYHERFRDEAAQPVWFERQFTFPLGRHVLRGRVDRVDRLPDGEYELIDYKTGRPKSAAALADDVQLSLYAVGAREAWKLGASRQAYYYLLDDEKVTVPDDDGERDAWVREVATEVAEGIRTQGFEPTPSAAACGLCDHRFICPAAER